MLVAGHWLLVAGYWSLVAGYWMLDARYWEKMVEGTGYKVKGARLEVIL